MTNIIISLIGLAAMYFLIRKKIVEGNSDCSDCSGNCSICNSKNIEL